MNVEHSNRLNLLSELMDSSLLEDEHKPQSYYSDCVKDLNEGRKSDRELSKKPDFTGMSECEKEENKKEFNKLVEKEYDCA